MSFRQRILIVAVLVAAAAGGAYYWWQQQQDTLPDNIASGQRADRGGRGSGRCQIRRSRCPGPGRRRGHGGKRPGPGPHGHRGAGGKPRQGQGGRRPGDRGRRGGQALIVQRESELKFAQQELARAAYLIQKGPHLQTIGRSEADRAGHRPGGARSGPRAPRQQPSARVESASAEARRIQTADR